ncbi:MAG: chemotaxis protein CheB [Comamonadaceae bacterium]|nr:MAG: chemotaxis protein CheB [Comamonadaceae bacterium]
MCPHPTRPSARRLPLRGSMPFQTPSTKPLPFCRLVVAGASLGGVAALNALVAALLVVLHTGGHPSVLPELLSSHGPLPAAHAQDGDALQAGRIYVAPPDHHMLVDGDRLRLTRGPKEHHTRPAIDPLFLSAALHHGPAVVGVVLSGTLEDGTAGLQAIKACGGVAMVQEPDEAQAPGMPLSVLRYVQVDDRLPVRELAERLRQLASEPPPAAPHAAPERLVRELRLIHGEGNFMEHLEAIASPAPFVCPDCKGGLWQVDESRPIRYRCHTRPCVHFENLAASLDRDDGRGAVDGDPCAAGAVGADGAAGHGAAAGRIGAAGGAARPGAPGHRPAVPAAARTGAGAGPRGSGVAVERGRMNKASA